MKAYQLGRRTSTTWSEPIVHIEEATRRLRARLVGKGPYDIKLRGTEEWSRKRGLPATMRRVKELMEQRDIGEAIWVRTTDPNQTHVVRLVGYTPLHEVPPIPSGAHPNLRPVWNYVWAHWHVVSWGIFNCRHVAGSTRWSYHAWWQGWDIHGPVEVMDAIYAYLNAHRHEFGIIELLYRVAGHYDHIHLAVEPVRDQYARPPCA